MKCLAFAFVALLCVPALAQDVLDEVANKIVLEEQAKSVDEVQERLTTQYEAANRHAIADLEGIARNAISQGEIADAAEAWEAVLSLNIGHKEAGEFFKTIGREEYKPERNDGRNVWVENGNPNRGFVRSRDGWIQMTDGKKTPWQEVGRTQHMITLSRENGDILRIHRDGLYGKGRTVAKWHFHTHGRWLR